MKQMTQSLGKILSRFSPALAAGFLSVCITHSVLAAPSQLPLFLTAPVKPILMLNMSNDHQLFFKAYDDYSNLTGGPNPDTTYVHSYRYYGYFNDATCYDYQNGRFEPHSSASGRYCDGQWSGNFLNWATMTRIDVVRKILYGGYRQVDTATDTVLERAMLPNDAHSFTKYYNGTDIHLLTPYDDVTSGLDETTDTGITICNTTDPATRSLSQSVNAPPLMRVVPGNYSLWASNERWQCRYGNYGNGNVPERTGLYARSQSPASGSDYNVRVKVCVPGLLEENCEPYGNNFKPRGLLQEYSRDDSLLFGLMTGSYVKNKSGGILRKNVGRISDEINADGTFVTPANGEGIINTLNQLRVYGYRFDDGTYHRGAHGETGRNGSDGCLWGRGTFADGHCTNWGNPIAEIYLESLRYLAGKAVNSEFAPTGTTDSAYISGLPQAAWTRPITQDNYCARASVLQFNASTISFDGDMLSGSNDIGLADVTTATNYVGSQEGISGLYFVGSASGETGGDQLCTAKNVTSLSDVRGICPEAPRLQGSYHIAGLAHHARRHGITVENVNTRVPVVTYGISLAPAVPRVTVPVPDASGGNSAQSITILPACRNFLAGLGATGGSCAIVDFKVYNQKTEVIDGVVTNTGSLYVNWEDSEQGGDYDQDMWGVLEYAVNAEEVTITTEVMAQSTGDPMGFGYVINGVADGGFHVHSGVNGFVRAPDCTAVDGNRCTCRASGQGVCDSPHAVPRSKVFKVGGAAAQSLKEPLYYAAKWGGYSFDEEKKAIKDSVSLDEMVAERIVANSYFYATNPWDLEDSLRVLFARAAEGVGVASSAATNSTRLTQGSTLYQASFDSTNWSGELKAWNVDPQTKVLSPIASATTNNKFETSESIDSGRKILTNHKGSTNLVDFTWSNLSDWQKEQLKEGEEGSESMAIDRLEWIRGSREKEGSSLRAREILLGDIVNSNPAFSGGVAARYLQLPSIGGNLYRTHAESKPEMLYVGANDGMLHAFDAKTFTEIFAYIPNGVYPKLANLSKPDYGGHFNPHQSLVDGQIYVGDAYINGGWKTVLVGSLGAGGRSVFALDVTKPTEPSLIFEIDNEDYPGLGYVFGQPLVAPLSNGRWAAIFGNGAEAGSSRLFVVDLAEPDSTHTRVINTGAGSGLATPALRPNLQGQIEDAYAGDLSGNVWKFDLTNFSVAYGQPLFQARDENNNVQPITGAVTLGLNEKIDPAAIMVYFGTGRYIYDGDNFAEAAPVHSFYAIADLDPSVTSITRSNGTMHEKSMSASDGVRVIAGERGQANGQTVSLMDWNTFKGWYLDFDLIAGERVITKPVLLMDRLIFNTIIPSSVPCDYGGRSFAMELVAVGDKNIGHTVLGPNANVEMDNLVVGEASVFSGKGGDQEGAKVDCDIEGNCDSAAMSFWGGWRGRMNWRQYR